jgi:hypothetical protein
LQAGRGGKEKEEKSSATDKLTGGLETINIPGATIEDHVDASQRREKM